MNGAALHFTLRELRRHLGPRALAAMLVVALVLGLSGPFGTYAQFPALPRLVYWAAVVGLTYTLAYLVAIWCDAALGAGRPLWQRVGLMALPAGVMATAVVSLCNLIAIGPVTLTLADTLVLLGECIAVALGVVTLVLLFAPPATVPVEPTAAAGAASQNRSQPPILERVPLPQRGRLLALTVEDHYVDIVTDRGKTLVLMRLADAIRETAGVDGLQIHRSHWVARNAVVRSHRADGRLSLELSNGLRLPVSRGFLPQVKAAGLG